MTTLEDIGKQLHDLRSNRGETLRDAARRMQMDFGRLGKIERGKLNVTITKLEGIANAMGCRLEVTIRPIDND